MARTGILAITLVLMAAMWTGSSAQTSSSCTNVLISMSPCLNYITGNSSTPSSGCCSQLASVVKSQPECLCQVISGSGSSASSLGININRTQALELPTACNVQTPSITRCTGAASPSGSSSTDSPSTANTGVSTTSTSSGSESPSGDTSDTNTLNSRLALYFALFFVASSMRDLFRTI